jgi:hypothetical protein
VAGRRHALALERYTNPEGLWLEFQASAPNWAPAPDPAVNEQMMQNVSRHWDYDELGTLGLRMRATCLHPSTMMKDLKPWQKARVWRYLRDVMGVGYYTEMAAIIAHVDADQGTLPGLDNAEESEPELEPELEGKEMEWRFINGRDRYVAKESSKRKGSHRDQRTHQLRDQGFVRIKELFESFEAYRQAANFIIAAEKKNAVPRIVELGAGHGLVGLLLAYRFPNMEVLMFDRQRRGIFDVFLRAFEAKGHVSPALSRWEAEPEFTGSKVLPNVRFIEADVQAANSPDTLLPHSVVLAIHGCNEVNQIAIEMALVHDCSWLVMPCCIRRQMYLSSCDVLLESDDARHAVMVGALASTYCAQFMGEIDRRITNRGVVVGGGVFSTGQLAEEGEPAVAAAVENKKKFRGNMPRLALS